MAGCGYRATGLPCLIVRNRFGALCGYVGVAEGHPLFGLSYSEVAPVSRPVAAELLDARGVLDLYDDELKACTVRIDVMLSAHGGITFADFCADSTNEAELICHVPGPGEPDRVWWFGFDCGHAGDLAPEMQARHPDLYTDIWRSRMNETYRDVPYVEDECASLAAQLKAIAEAA